MKQVGKFPAIHDFLAKHYCPHPRDSNGNEWTRFLTFLICPVPDVLHHVFFYHVIPNPTQKITRMTHLQKDYSLIRDDLSVRILMLKVAQLFNFWYKVPILAGFTSPILPTHLFIRRAL